MKATCFSMLMFNNAFNKDVLHIECQLLVPSLMNVSYIYNSFLSGAMVVSQVSDYLCGLILTQILSFDKDTHHP